MECPRLGRRSAFVRIIIASFLFRHWIHSIIINCLITSLLLPTLVIVRLCILYFKSSCLLAYAVFIHLGFGGENRYEHRTIKNRCSKKLKSIICIPLIVEQRRGQLKYDWALMSDDILWFFCQVFDSIISALQHVKAAPFACVYNEQTPNISKRWRKVWAVRQHIIVMRFSFPPYWRAE